ncbi:BTB/POZ and MATH domain-containing protein 4-like [Phragmites australis]|uniref:BTB/POZ and MATH domain-containing protein 4-like n=1 Tax=Phragmites australis TaxID=29695 RepID=UPI002D769FDA|nr:BTB/POZ and MATH domain-containing protein 4-like [Phragmites australis]
MSTATGVSVCTAVATAAATKCYMFKIEGYKRIKTMHGNGKGLESCAFEVAGHTWRIQFFPDGNKKENAGYVSLFLKLEDLTDDAGNDDVLAEVQLSLVRHRGKGKPAACQPYSKTYTSTFNMGNKVWGFPLFIKREDLEKSEFLKDGCFAVRCDLAVLNKSVDVQEQAAQAGDLERLNIVCDCKDDLCKRHHHQRDALWLREAFVKFFLRCFQV